MNITENKNGNQLCLSLEGRLDTTTAPELEKVIKSSLDGVTELTIDMSSLDYLSSAGLRILLGAQKTMNKQGSMKVTHVNDTIMEIFEVTGFVDILTIEALLYSTCTINPAENESNTAWFLQEHPQFRLEKQQQILPQKGKQDGFYLAKLHKENKTAPT